MKKPFTFPARLALPGLSIYRVTSIPLICSFLFLLYVMPLIVLGERSYITIHDNLDGIVANLSVLARNGYIFDFSGNVTVPQIMNGLPRSAMSSGFNLIFLFFAVFPPFTAYLINHLLIHIAAFGGMVLFLKRYLARSDGMSESVNVFLVWGTALAFSVLPFYSMYGLTITGQPLVLYAFLNFLNRREKLTDVFIILLFPFYANFLLIGIFIIPALFLFLLVDWVKQRSLNRKAFLILCGFSLLFALTEYDFLHASLISHSYASHRSEWGLDYISFPLSGVWKNITDMFLHGQYHAPSHQEWILGISAAAVLLAFFRKQKAPIQILGLVSVQFLIAALYGFYFWDILIPIKERFGLLSSFNLGRVHWLSPFLWYCILFLALVEISKILPKKALLWSIIGIAVITQIAVNLAYNSDYGHYLSKIIYLPGFQDDRITYRQFYAEKQFQNIRDFIGLPQEDYRVVSIGIHPAIAQYNGFYTLDSYQSNYPLLYKQQFRKIIAAELVKSPGWQHYFDDWGSRCYIFSSEVGDFQVKKDAGQAIKSLNLNTASLKDMGGRFVFSALEIRNHQEEGLSLEGIFEEADSVWKVYLYRVD